MRAAEAETRAAMGRSRQRACLALPCASHIIERDHLRSEESRVRHEGDACFRTLHGDTMAGATTGACALIGIRTACGSHVLLSHGPQASPPFSTVYNSRCRSRPWCRHRQRHSRRHAGRLLDGLFVARRRRRSLASTDVLFSHPPSSRDLLAEGTIHYR